MCFHSAWWAKYNYVLVAALDTGTALSGIIIFLAVSYNNYSDWWGSTVYLNTADGNDTAYYPVTASGMFGPASGSWAWLCYHSFV